MSCASEKELAGFIAGLVDPEPAAALRAHLERCEHCRSRHTTMAAMTRRLAPDAGEFQDPNLVADVMRAVRAAEVPSPSRLAQAPRVWRWLWAPILTASATIVLLLARPFSSDQPDGFLARGGGAANPDRWVSIEIFRATGAGYRRVVDRIAPEDALAFAYSNRGDEGYRYLVIVAMDETGEVFWYYPAHEQGASGVGITRTAHADLPDEIRHRLRPGRLRVFALFSKETRAVADVEQALRQDLRIAKGLDRLERVSLPGTGQQSFLLTVSPTYDAGSMSGAP
jgi:hypothetical protein